MAKADGMYGMFFGILDTSEKKGETIAKQKAHILKLLETGVDFLSKRNYNDAKNKFGELKGYLKINQDKKDKFNFAEDIPFFTLLGYCYSFLMCEKRDKKEEDVIQKDIQVLLKMSPKRQIVKFLELLFAYKKELWGECLFRCESLQNMVLDSKDEEDYKCPNLMNKHAVPELDYNYCVTHIENIQEAAMYGHMEKLIKMEKNKGNRKVDFTGLDWTKLWSAELNGRVMKRLRSFKKPMNEVDLHKVFHGTVLPMLYGSCCPTSKSLYFYYRQEYLFKCEECLRAKVQHDTKEEVIRRMTEENIAHHGVICSAECEDCFLDDDDDDIFSDDDEEMNSDEDYLIDVEKKELIPIKRGEFANKTDTNTSTKVTDTIVDNKTKVDTNFQTDNFDNKAKSNKVPSPKKITDTEKPNTKKSKQLTKEKEIQTDRQKINHRYCQTEGIKFKSFGVQVELIKKTDNAKPKTEYVKCAHCLKTESILNAALKDEFDTKNVISNELKELKCMFNEHSFKKETENNGKKELILFMQTLERIEKNQHDIIEKIKNQKEDQSCKITFLQKVLLDQVNEKYCIYKEIYAGLEKKCKFFITSVAKLHNYLNGETFPTRRENNVYLHRWQKTLSEIQTQNKELKVFYKKSKSRVINLNEYECNDWPQIAEIPVEALAYIFDSLRANAKFEKETNNGFRENPGPTKVTKTVRIITPTTEMEENNRSDSPVSSVESSQKYDSAESNVEAPHINNYSNMQNNNQSRYADQPPSSPYFRSDYVENYEPIPMPPSRSTTYDSDIVHQPHEGRREISPAPSPIPSPAPQLQTPVPQLQSPVPQMQTHAPQTQSPVPPVQSPALAILPLEFYRNFPPPPLPSTIRISNSDTKTQENISRERQNSSSTKEEEYHEERELLVNRADYNTTPDSDSVDQYDGDNEIVPYNMYEVKQKTSQRNLFEPKFGQVKHTVINEEPSLYRVPVKDATPKEPCESESNTSLENYTGNQRMKKVKLKNVDEHGREIVEKKPNSDQEIFSYIQQHCSDVPEDDLINAILTVMRQCNDGFSFTPKQQILKQVKAALPSKTPWKSTNVPLPEWHSDTVDTHCSICFENLSNGLTYNLPCKHRFHKHCIKEWLQTNSVCPICRVHSIFDEDFPPLM